MLGTYIALEKLSEFHLHAGPGHARFVTPPIYVDLGKVKTGVSSTT